MKALRHPALHWLLGIGLGAVFIYASIDKIEQPREFARIVYHYRLIGPSAALGFVPANAFSVALPWIEALTGLLLIVASGAGKLRSPWRCCSSRSWSRSAGRSPAASTSRTAAASA